MTLYEQQQGLIKALKRYGYNLEGRGQCYAYGGQYGLHSADPVNCKNHKPIRVHTVEPHCKTQIQTKSPDGL